MAYINLDDEPDVANWLVQKLGAADEPQKRRSADEQAGKYESRTQFKREVESFSKPEKEMEKSPPQESQNREESCPSRSREDLLKRIDDTEIYVEESDGVFQEGAGRSIFYTDRQEQEEPVIQFKKALKFKGKKSFKEIVQKAVSKSKEEPEIKRPSVITPGVQTPSKSLKSSQNKKKMSFFDVVKLVGGKKSKSSVSSSDGAPDSPGSVPGSPITPFSFRYDNPLIEENEYGAIPYNQEDSTSPVEHCQVSHLSPTGQVQESRNAGVLGISKQNHTTDRASKTPTHVEKTACENRQGIISSSTSQAPASYPGVRRSEGAEEFTPRLVSECIVSPPASHTDRLADSQSLSPLSPKSAGKSKWQKLRQHVHHISEDVAGGDGEPLDQSIEGGKEPTTTSGNANKDGINSCTSQSDSKSINVNPSTDVISKNAEKTSTSDILEPLFDSTLHAQTDMCDDDEFFFPTRRKRAVSDITFMKHVSDLDTDNRPKSDHHGFGHHLLLDRTWSPSTPQPIRDLPSHCIVKSNDSISKPHRESSSKDIPQAPTPSPDTIIVVSPADDGDMSTTMESRSRSLSVANLDTSRSPAFSRKTSLRASIRDLFSIGKKKPSQLAAKGLPESVSEEYVSEGAAGDTPDAADEATSSPIPIPRGKRSVSFAVSKQGASSPLAGYSELPPRRGRARSFADSPTSSPPAAASPKKKKDRPKLNIGGLTQRAGSLPNLFEDENSPRTPDNKSPASETGHSPQPLQLEPLSFMGEDDNLLMTKSVARDFRLRKLSIIPEGIHDEAAAAVRRNESPTIAENKPPKRTGKSGSADPSTTNQPTMFGRKTHGDVKKSAAKILDSKKDTVTRLKHLRVVLENYEISDAKNFFEQNYSYIYYIFHDVFTNVEADLRQRASKAHREELDFVLFIFEKILTLLPELIHKRWQYHSIGWLMKKLLHPGNSLKLRREGMRLFLIWYQILMDNATEECHKTYKSLVPKLDTPESSDADIFTVRNFPNTKVTPVEITPMLQPQSGDKQPENMTRWLLDNLLLYMVAEVNKIEWMNREMHEFSFNFLFNQFKEFYLRNIFPDFKDTTIYNPNLDLPCKRKLDDVDGPQRPHTTGLCQELVVKWLTTFMYSSKRPDPTSASGQLMNQDRPPDDIDNDGTLEARVPGSNSSTLSQGTVYTEKDSSSSVCSDDALLSEQEIVKKVLYNTRENVNIVHEVFRQAFLFPFHNNGAVLRVVKVYKDWFQDSMLLDAEVEGKYKTIPLDEPLPEDKNQPVFMHEMDNLQKLSASPTSVRSGPSQVDGVSMDKQSQNTVQSATTVQSDKPTDTATDDSGHSSPQKSVASSETNTNPATKDTSATESIESDGALQPSDGSLGNGSAVSDSYNYHVKAGLQRVLQVFITNSGNVFLLDSTDALPSEIEAKLSEQVDLCKRILNIYRYMVMNHHLEKHTWEQLLLVLLRITSGVLNKKPSPHRETLGGRLAQPLFQTLIVTWIKANLNVHVSPELWDHFLLVLSSLTGWEELIKEWAKTMETLTRVLARHMYNLDLNDLPLDRLSEQKEKRRRGAKPVPSGSPANHRSTFSRGWSRHDAVESLRAKYGGVGKSAQSDPINKTLSSSNHAAAISQALESNGMMGHPKLGHQRSRSGEVSPIMQSSHTNLSCDTQTLDVGGPLVRSNSDSSLMIPDIDHLKKGPHDLTPQRGDPIGADEVLEKMVLSQGVDVEDVDVLSASYVTTLSFSLTHTGGPLEESQTSRSPVGSPTSLASMYFSAPEDIDTEDDNDVEDAEDEGLSTLASSKSSGGLSGNGSSPAASGNGSLHAIDAGNSETPTRPMPIARATSIDRHRDRRLSRSPEKYRNGSESTLVPTSPSILEICQPNFRPTPLETDLDTIDFIPKVSSIDKVISITVTPQTPMLKDKGDDASEHDSDDVFMFEKGNLGPGGDDQSVTASITSTITDNASLTSVDSNLPYQIMESTGESPGAQFDRASFGERSDRSDTDVLLHLADQESLSPHSNGLRASPEVSPIANGPPNTHGTEGNIPNGIIPRGLKETTPTPDRDSLHIEDDVVENNNRVVKVREEVEEDKRSVVAGGHLVGWTQEVAVVLWQRMLGALGDINKLENPEIHAQVYDYLCDLLDLLCKIRDNIGVTKDNQSSPTPPEFLPPILHFVPWLFDALTLPSQYKRGKNLAYRILCVGTARRQDVPLPNDHLLRFYKALHHGLVHADQDTTNVLVRHCSAKFFSLPLPGSSMMVLDFIHAANTIASSTDLKEAPRADAVSILGALLCFPAHFGEIPALQPNSKELTMMQCNDALDHIINILIKSGKKEPAGLARCIAISSLGVYLYSELSRSSFHPKLKEATQVLLSTIKFNNKSVAQVAVDMLVLMCDHVDVLLENQPDLPRKIVEDVCKTLSILLNPTEHSNSEEDKRLMVSIMFCLLEWCMRIPLPQLLDSQPGQKSLIYKAFRVLNLIVSGSQGLLTPRGHLPPSELVTQDEDIESLKETTSHSVPSTPKGSIDIVSEYASRSQKGQPGQSEGRSTSDNNILKLSARMVMNRLVNHLGHFPMASGASQLNTTVQENHDLSDPVVDELNHEIFKAPNVQFFVLNNATLISFIEIPALLNVPGGGVTAGLTTDKTLCRVIIRDTSGKFCWDSSILYGPPKCRAGSYPAAPLRSLHIDEDIDQIGRQSGQPKSDAEEDAVFTPDNPISDWKVSDLPVYDGSVNNQEHLDWLLGYVGHTSPECLLRPGEPLNDLFPTLEDLASTTEEVTSEILTDMSTSEGDYFDGHKTDSSMLAAPLEPMSDREVSSPFQLCRLFLNQQGFLQWEKRTRFDLLKKTDKLLRDLKHLDNQKCRETYKIAVIYVAEGQEDKQSILMNDGGSQAYEEFVAGLGWEVDLEYHKGFMGGLQTNKSTGLTAPYFATSTREVVYHVATRMPCEEGEDKPGHKKVRHLGNDEVQIIWSEHWRDYRRGIIPTEFGDVLIVIYPLKNGLCRIQINRKPEVPYFGPLFDGALVDHKILPGLVRATAINASQVLRAAKPFYQAFYEERAKYMDNIIQQNKELTTFEDFAAQVYSPIAPKGGDLIGSHPLFSANEHSSMTTSYSGSSLSGDIDGGKLAATEKPSPVTSTKSGKDESNSFTRRLSFGKSKKSVKAKQQAHDAAVLRTGTPPGSPDTGQSGKK